MQQGPQENLEMHDIDAQTIGPHQNIPMVNFAHQSRSRQDTRSTSSSIFYRTVGGPSETIQTSEGPTASAALSVTSRVSSPSLVPSLVITTPTEEDGPHLRSSGCGHETTAEPLLPGPDDIDFRPTQCCRSRSALTTYGQMLLDLCIAAASLYFLAFAIAAFVHEGDPAKSNVPDKLLQAARFGPTILPVMFAAIVGRFLTSYTAWRLEHKIRLATVEHLMGSRTVFGVISTPFRLKMMHVCMPFLFILWTLSPLGGQASLRAVYSSPVRTKTAVEVCYLDTSSPFSVQIASEADNLKDAINSAFVGALASPAASKGSSQDVYGNLKVPFLEDLTTQSDPNEEGWYSTQGAKLEYSSLVGIPVEGLKDGGSLSLRLVSSYVFPSCVLSSTLLAPNSSARAVWDKFQDENCNNGLYHGMVLHLNNATQSYPRPASGPRTVVFGSLGNADDGTLLATIATCNLTATQVETNYTCEGKSCTPTALRRSRALHDYTAASQQLQMLTGLWSWSQIFCAMFINATGNSPGYTSSPMEQFIVDPDVPFRFAGAGERLILADVGEHIFALRFAQLLNSYWMIGIAPYAIIGGLKIPEESSNKSSFGLGDSICTTDAQFQTAETFLFCSKPWLIVLVISSLTMLTAGIATMILNLLRRGPEILDSFTSSLRDSPYIHGDIGPTTEDGPDKARRLADMEVMLGDVRPKAEIGYIAVATDTEERHVERLRPSRRYL